VTPGLTPSQTIGPFFEFALLDRDRSYLVSPDHPRAVRIEGAVYDGAGEPIDDAMLEVWQADEDGRYHHPADGGRDGAPPEDGFTGFGRCGTDEEGRFSFVTVKPGRVPGPGGAGEPWQAPHLAVSVFARGLLKRLVTRIYFPDEEAANAEDPVLALVEDPKLRETLIARDEGAGVLRFDVHLQGERQTAFFDV
jgi:protocatechuate 3,4-dioxygenase alpha subunit